METSFEYWQGGERYRDGRVKPIDGGVQVSMWGGENVLTLLFASRQDGTLEAILVYVTVDSTIRTTTVSRRANGRKQEAAYVEAVVDAAMEYLRPPLSAESVRDVRENVEDAVWQGADL